MSVVNDSQYDVYVRVTDGGDINILNVTHNTPYTGDQDGVAIPHFRPYEILKTVRGIDVYVGSKGEISVGTNALPGSLPVPLGPIVDTAIEFKQVLSGGWKDREWGKGHPEWKQLFDVAVPPK